MPLTITLTCFCGFRSQDTCGWYAITPATGSITPRVLVCSEACGASWFMRRQLERERAQGLQPHRMVIEYQGSGTFIPPLPPLADPPSTTVRPTLEAGSWGNAAKGLG